jgi:hypothetical protein
LNIRVRRDIWLSIISGRKQKCQTRRDSEAVLAETKMSDSAIRATSRIGIGLTRLHTALSDFIDCRNSENDLNFGFTRLSSTRSCRSYKRSLKAIYVLRFFSNETSHSHQVPSNKSERTRRVLPLALDTKRPCHQREAMRIRYAAASPCPLISDIANNSEFHSVPPAGLRLEAVHQRTSPLHIQIAMPSSGLEKAAFVCICLVMNPTYISCST